MNDKTKEKIVKWGLIGVGSVISLIGSMIKLKPEENLFEEDPEEVEAEFEVKDEEIVEGEVEE